MSVAATRWAIDEAPHSIGGSAMAVLLVMADLANERRWWQVWIDRDSIARRARVSRATAGAALKALEAADIVSKVEAEEQHPEIRKASRTVVWRLHVDVPIGQNLADTAPCIGQNPDSYRPESGRSIDAPPLIPLTQEERKAAPVDPRKEIKALSRAITSAWWESQNPRPMMQFIAAVRIVETALKAGWTEAQVRAALPRVNGALVKWKLEEALHARAGSRVGERSEDELEADPYLSAPSRANRRR